MRSGIALSFGKYLVESKGTTKATMIVTIVGMMKQSANIIRRVVQYCLLQNDGAGSKSCSFSSSLTNNRFSFSVSMMEMTCTVERSHGYYTFMNFVRLETSQRESM